MLLCVEWIRDGARLMLSLIIVNVNKLFGFLTREASQTFMHNAAVLFAVPASLEIQVFNCSDMSLINNAKMRRKTQLSQRGRIIAHFCSQVARLRTAIYGLKTASKRRWMTQLCKCHEILSSSLVAIS